MLWYNTKHGEITMAAGTYDLIIDQGADFSLGLALTDGGVAVDLTGYSGRAQMRSKKSSAAIAATFVVTVTSEVGGTITMTLTNAVTAALSPGVYFYDLEIYTAADALVSKLLFGKATVREEVTR